MVTVIKDTDPSLARGHPWKSSCNLICVQIVCVQIKCGREETVMWTHEYSAQTDLAPEAVWKVIADLDNWAAWDTSMESVRLDGPFAVGSRVTMVPAGQDPVTSIITVIEENQRYADETEFGGVTLRFSHALTGLAGGGTRVVHRLEVDGPGEGEIGEMVSEDFPAAMAALLAYAARGDE